MNNLTPVNINDHLEERNEKEGKKDYVENQSLFDEFNPRVKKMVWDAYHLALELKTEGKRTWGEDVQADIARSLFPEALEWVEKNQPGLEEKVSDIKERGFNL